MGYPWLQGSLGPGGSQTGPQALGLTRLGGRQQRGPLGRGHPQEMMVTR